MKKVMIFMILLNIVFAKDIKIALGDSLPPYIIPPNSGMEYEVIKRAFEIKGYKVNPVFVPFARLFKSVEQGTYDGVATVKEDKKMKNIYYSDEYITYENVVVSLKKYEINSMKDLEGKTVISFQNSTKYLGGEYEKTVKSIKNYSEIANQEGQVASLMNGRIDVIIIEEKIFMYYLKKSKLIKPRPYIIYRIFKPTAYKLAFKNKKVRDEFNEGLKFLKSSGEYEKIIKKYIE